MILGFVGTMAKLWGMAIFGIILVVIGLVNKRKWGKEKYWFEMDQTARKRQKIAVIIALVVGLALIIGSVPLIE